MKIAILGSGRMGGTLGGLWARCGHQVTFAYFRNARMLERRARQSGLVTASVREAVADADAVLLSVHWTQVGDVLEQAGPMSGKVVLNCCVPLDESDTDLVLGPRFSGAEWLAQQRPEARWVCCFNTSPSESLLPVFGAKGRNDPPQLLTYGDDAGAKVIARQLIRDIGFEPLEAGALRTGRFVEPFAMVTSELAYGQPGSPALVYRFEKLRGDAQD